MSQTLQVQEFHPRRDGKSEERYFLKLLSDAIGQTPNGRRRAELRVVQARLLARGWHP
ncbi:MAG: hypothetical protein ABSD41_07605 [Candidatus Bathyarchaeia archaeon]